jgi:hypothetical protein
MKKILLISIAVLTLALVSVSSYSEIFKKDIVCDSREHIFKTLTGEDYEELPVWTGNDEKSMYAMFANSKTGTWSLVQFNKDTACILGTGEKHRFVGKNVI